MDSLITAAARALASGDVLGALGHVALRDDPPALAIRGIAMARLGDLDRARLLLRRAARGFGPEEAVARARCVVAEAEIGLVCRDLGRPLQPLAAARLLLERRGDRVNAAHAGYLEARMQLLIGRLDEAEQRLAGLDPAPLPAAARASHLLVVAGIAMRRMRIGPAKATLVEAARLADESQIPALVAEVEAAARLLELPAARAVTRGRQESIRLAQIERLLGSDTLVVDTYRRLVCRSGVVATLATRPVLLALVRGLAEAWPEGASRMDLLERAFRARHADESHRARLRVEIGRLRRALNGLARIEATAAGFALVPCRPGEVVVLAPPTDEAHAGLQALLADGESWSSSSLALALGLNPRSIQRALEDLASVGKVQAVGRGRARRWMAPPVPGFPTALLLPTALPAS